MSNKYDPDKLINDITHDRLHGANYLSNAALGVMVALALNANAVDSHELIEQLKTYAKRLIVARPSMAPIPNKLGQLFSLLPESDSMRKTLSPLLEYRNQPDTPFGLQSLREKRGAVSPASFRAHSFFSHGIRKT